MSIESNKHYKIRIIGLIFFLNSIFSTVGYLRNYNGGYIYCSLIQDMNVYGIGIIEMEILSL